MKTIVIKLTLILLLSSLSVEGLHYTETSVTPNYDSHIVATRQLHSKLCPSGTLPQMKAYEFIAEMSSIRAECKASQRREIARVLETYINKAFQRIGIVLQSNNFVCRNSKKGKRGRNRKRRALMSRNSTEQSLFGSMGEIELRGDTQHHRSLFGDFIFFGAGRCKYCLDDDHDSRRLLKLVEAQNSSTRDFLGSSNSVFTAEPSKKDGHHLLESRHSVGNSRPNAPQFQEKWKMQKTSQYKKDETQRNTKLQVKNLRYTVHSEKIRGSRKILTRVQRRRCVLEPNCTLSRGLNTVISEPKTKRRLAKVPRSPTHLPKPTRTQRPKTATNKPATEKKLTKVPRRPTHLPKPTRTQRPRTATNKPTTEKKLTKVPRHPTHPPKPTGTQHPKSVKIMQRLIDGHGFQNKLNNGWRGGRITQRLPGDFFLGPFGIKEKKTSRVFKVPEYVSTVRFLFQYIEIYGQDKSGKAGTSVLTCTIGGKVITLGSFTTGEQNLKRSGIEHGISWSRKVVRRTINKGAYDATKHGYVLNIPPLYFAPQNEFMMTFSVRASYEAGGFDNFYLFALFPLSLCRNSLLYSYENFEGTRNIWDKWSIDRVTNGGEKLTKYLGKFSQGDNTGRLYRIEFTPPFVQVKFDLYELDMWDGNKGEARDYVTVYIDGEKLDLGYFHHRKNEMNRSDITKGGIKWRMTSSKRLQKVGDQIHHVVAIVPLEFYAYDKEIELFFHFVTNEKMINESGGVDNVKITAVYNDCTSNNLDQSKKDKDKTINRYKLRRKEARTFHWPKPPTNEEFTNDFAFSMEEYLHEVLVRAIEFHFQTTHSSHCLYETNPAIFVTLFPKTEWKDHNERTTYCASR